MDNQDTGTTTVKPEVLFCDSCGKNLTSDSESLVGMSLELKQSIKNKRGFTQKQMGPYVLGKTYRVCWECLLRSLGVKP